MSKTYKELLAERRELEARIEAAMRSERDEALATIRELMTLYGITAGELATKRGSRKAAPVAPKYRDPESGQTWTGRGKAPAWIAGQDRARFAIVGDYCDHGDAAG
ncbi:H-NS histone family protein [Burkholderia sp. MR1-5-21]